MHLHICSLCFPQMVWPRCLNWLTPIFSVYFFPHSQWSHKAKDRKEKSWHVHGRLFMTFSQSFRNTIFFMVRRYGTPLSPFVNQPPLLQQTNKALMFNGLHMLYLSHHHPLPNCQSHEQATETGGRFFSLLMGPNSEWVLHLLPAVSQVPSGPLSDPVFAASLYLNETEVKGCRSWGSGVMLGRFAGKTELLYHISHWVWHINCHLYIMSSNPS